MPPRKLRRYTSFLIHLSLSQMREIQHRPSRCPPRSRSECQRQTKGIESGTDSTTTSIRMIQGSQSTLTPASPVVYDLTTGSSVAMLRRLNAQEMPTAGTPSQSEWEGKGDLTLSLITNGSMTTFSSAPGTPSFVRLGGDGFIPQPSALKESKAAPGGGLTSRIGMRRRQEQSPLVHAGVGWGEMSEKDERYLRPTASWIYLRCIPCLHYPASWSLRQHWGHTLTLLHSPAQTRRARQTWMGEETRERAVRCIMTFTDRIRLPSHHEMRRARLQYMDIDPFSESSLSALSHVWARA